MTMQLCRQLTTFKCKPTILISVTLGQGRISGDSGIYWILKRKEEAAGKTDGVEKKELVGQRNIMTKEKSYYVRKKCKESVFLMNKVRVKNEEDEALRKKKWTRARKFSLGASTCFLQEKERHWKFLRREMAYLHYLYRFSSSVESEKTAGRECVRSPGMRW